MQQKVLRFFDLILRHDENTIHSITECQGDLFLRHEISTNKKIEQGNTLLIFSLSGLHEYLDTEKLMDYKSFRRLIYQGSINRELGELGGKIEIHSSTGKVDESLYKLVLLTHIIIA